MFVLTLVAASMTACAQPDPVDTPLGRLRADVDAMKAFPSASVSHGCAAALRELTSTANDIQALQQRGKAVDPVSEDVLQSNQSEAEKARHPDALRVCQAPDSPAAATACSRVTL
jgi:hypothetical protein